MSDPMAEVKETFRQFNTRGNGAIAACELRELLVSLGGFSEADIDRTIRAFGAADDGMVPFDAFVDWISAAANGAAAPGAGDSTGADSDDSPAVRRRALERALRDAGLLPADAAGYAAKMERLGYESLRSLSGLGREELNTLMDAVGMGEKPGHKSLLRTYLGPLMRRETPELQIARATSPPARAEEPEFPAEQPALLVRSVSKISSSPGAPRANGAGAAASVVNAAGARADMVVISYATSDREFMVETKGILSKFGLDPWSGEDVKPGAHWMPQWIEKVEDERCKLVVFILSKSFVSRKACRDEFFWVMQDTKLSEKVIPLMYEDFQLPKEFSMMLVTKNYLTISPKVALRQWDTPEHRPDAEWHDGFWTAANVVVGSLVPLRNDDFRQPKNMLHNLDMSCDEVQQLFIHRVAEDLKVANEDVDSVRLLGVIGSRSFFNSKSEQVCKAIGKALGELSKNDKTCRYAIVTGGVSGVGETLARSFAEARGQREGTYMVLPHNDPNMAVNGAGAPLSIGTDKEIVFPSDEIFFDMEKSQWQPKGVQDIKDACPDFTGFDQLRFREWDFGTTMFYGATDQQRKIFLSCTSLLIMIEGGLGAKQEADLAIKGDRIVIPVGCLGGKAKDLAAELDAPVASIQKEWDSLQDASAIDPEALAKAIATIIPECFNSMEMKEQTISLKKSRTSDPLGAAVWEAPRYENIAVQNVMHASIDNLLLINATAPKGSPGLAQERTVQGLELMLQHLEATLPDAVIVSLDAHGASNQIKDKDLMRKQVSLVKEKLDNEFGEGKWVIMYGGDPYIPDVVDAAHVVSSFHNDHGVKIIATQCDEYTEAIIRPESHYDFLTDGIALFYPTTRKINPTTRMKEIQYGGFGGFSVQKEVVGATAIWLHERMLRSGKLKMHVLLGGGPIARDNMRAYLDRKLPVMYVPVLAKNAPQGWPEGKDFYGQAHETLACLHFGYNYLTDDCRNKMWEPRKDDDLALFVLDPRQQGTDAEGR